MTSHASSVVQGDSAQSVDPTTISLPDLGSAPPSHSETYEDDFYFYKPGVPYQTALSDIKECDFYSRVLNPTSRVLPFVPVGKSIDPESTQAKVLTNAWFMYGPVGMAIAAIAIDSVRSDMQHSNMRRCMQFHGYQRYGTSGSISSELSGDGPQKLEAKLALIASGRHPPGEAVIP